ncbi:uncharacterized protein LOC133288840 isoform X2 [Gastrolobium bilobum]|uniref:uncharacterized protein LOC133288840 isoform X2 n=1 Tax=Gastrolobium bilobum TaxID=150636 RepID=UPI002AB25402|nr:uncharacterized protein LOC133288840 isoform X2 [Gastrolobium bilobum]
MDEWKRSGQIPAFGNWDLENELPITQYFENARQAGLLRYSSSSSGDFNKPSRVRNHKNNNINHSALKHKQETRNREMRCPHVMVNKGKPGKVYDVMEQPIRKSKQLQKYDVVPRPPKPVDEDLYKIPPELLHTTKRKMLGFISKCLVPADCVS